MENLELNDSVHLGTGETIVNISNDLEIRGSTDLAFLPAQLMDAMDQILLELLWHYRHSA